MKSSLFQKKTWMSKDLIKRIDNRILKKRQEECLLNRVYWPEGVKDFNDMKISGYFFMLINI